DMAADRVRAGDLLDLIGQPAVRRRFELTDDDIEVLAGWVDRAGIRWGVDGTQRSRFGMAGFPQGTASTGRDRLLLGVLAEESGNEWLGVGLPLEGIESTKIDLAGRFAELVDRLGSLLTACDGRRPAEEWATLLVEAVDLLTAPDHDTQWQRAQAVGMVTDTLGAPSARGLDLGLSDVRDQMSRLLAARPTRANFCTGELTVCTLTPMRSVPHRAVILLGIDTGVYPRSPGVDGDDVLGLVPMVGERDWRDEDRQIFLDSLGAAVDHFFVFYTGADPVTGATVPPPVVVSELIDLADRTMNRDSGQKNVPGVLRRHTLHAFDVRNFVGEDSWRPRSYDASLVDAARSLATLQHRGDGGSPLPRLSEIELPAVDPPGDVDLADLVAFYKDPLAAFVRERLGARLPEYDEGHHDQLDIDLDGLQGWKIGDRRLRGILAGDDPAELRGAELRRGSLPPFAMGARVLQPIEGRAEAIGGLALTHRADQPARSVDVRHRLPDGRRLYGTVGDVFGDTLVEVTYSRLKPENRLAAWIRLVALAAAGDDSVTEAVAVGAGRVGAEQRRLVLPDDPHEVLRSLILIRDAGLRAPLWMPARAAEVAARGARRPTTAIAAVRGLPKFVFDDPYAGWVLYDDPARRGAPNDLIGLAGKSVFLELESSLPEIDAFDGDPSGAGRSFVRLANAVFSPLFPGESQR
ncbi:MAG: exodeoxyribonuclease V subunit gamma, partial [Gordonia sp. (in: high G+C Gram-positive bacteria)]